MSTSYKQVAKGSSGDSVLQLQKILNQNGYSLAEDGIFGNDTLKAVTDYQTKNGLAVDGVVGNETWGSLTKANTSSNQKNNASNGFSYDDFSYGDYQESDAVTQAQAALQQQLLAKPGAYESQWQGQINSIIDKIMNREEFSYDVNSDALYQQYKDQYTALGKLAMKDTMGQAAAMTGGYGNSYASTAGNQAYQSYLSQLNEVVPELYGMALDKYNQEGQDLYNQYGLLADQENQDYGRYQDSYNQWLTERDYLTGVYNDERNFDYGKYVDDRNFAYGTYADDKSYAYDEYRNAIADEQWQKEYALKEEQWELQKEQYTKEAEANTKSYSGTTKSGTSYNNGSLTNSQVKELQAALGVATDGYYGPDSKKAAGGLSAAEAYAKYVSGGGSQQGDTQSAPTSGITSSIESKAESFESNDSLANWAYGLADAGTITEEEADTLISTYMDHNEKYVDNGNGGKSISYSEMVKSTSGWSVVNDGGINWLWGVDNNAILKAPNGEQIRLDNLVDYLVNEGMNKSTAKDYVKKLQKNLGV